MVVAEQVAEAVRGEMQQLTVEPAPGLPARGVDRDHDVAQEVRLLRTRRALALREREHVGRPVLVAVVAVERPDLRVVDQAQRDLVVGAAVAAGGRAHHARDLGAQPAQRARGHLGGIDRQREGHPPGRVGRVHTRAATNTLNSSPSSWPRRTSDDRMSSAFSIGIAFLYGRSLAVSAS